MAFLHRAPPYFLAGCLILIPRRFLSVLKSTHLNFRSCLDEIGALIAQQIGQVQFLSGQDVITLNQATRKSPFDTGFFA
jgi:hypothetical protein